MLLPEKLFFAASSTTKNLIEEVIKPKKMIAEAHTQSWLPQKVEAINIHEEHTHYAIRMHDIKFSKYCSKDLEFP